MRIALGRDGRSELSAGKQRASASDDLVESQLTFLSAAGDLCHCGEAQYGAVIYRAGRRLRCLTTDDGIFGGTSNIFQVTPDGELEAKWSPGDSQRLEGKQKYCEVFDISSAASSACLFNEDPDVALPRQVRKAIGKSIAHVTEVYSEPRVTPLCAKCGLQSGSAMDLRTGFDFSGPSCQKRAWAVLESESPFLVVLSPSCTVWSSLRNLSNHKRDPEVLRKEEKDALTHLELSAKMARWQHERGGLFILEQPATARSWKQPCLELLCNMDGIILVQTDLCEFGLKVGDVGLNRKPTGLLVNSLTMAQSLVRKCTHESSEHETLVAHRGVSASKAGIHATVLPCHFEGRKVLERSGTLRYPQGKSEDYYLEPVFSHYSQEVQETANAMAKNTSEDFLGALWGETYFEVDDPSGGTYPSVGIEPGGEAHDHARPDEGTEGFEGAAPGNGPDPDFENDGEYPELDPDPVGGDVEEPSAVHKRLIQRAHVNL